MGRSLFEIPHQADYLTCHSTSIGVLVVTEDGFLYEMAYYKGNTFARMMLLARICRGIRYAQFTNNHQNPTYNSLGITLFITYENHIAALRIFKTAGDLFDFEVIMKYDMRCPGPYRMAVSNLYLLIANEYPEKDKNGCFNAYKCWMNLIRFNKIELIEYNLPMSYVTKFCYEGGYIVIANNTGGIYLYDENSFNPIFMVELRKQPYLIRVIGLQICCVFEDDRILSLPLVQKDVKIKTRICANCEFKFLVNHRFRPVLENGEKSFALCQHFTPEIARRIRTIIRKNNKKFY